MASSRNLLFGRERKLPYQRLGESPVLGHFAPPVSEAGGCVVSVPSGPDFTDADCWLERNNAEFDTGTDTLSRLSATSISLSIDRTVIYTVADSDPWNGKHRAEGELANFTDDAGVTIYFKEPPCQPRPCSNSIKLSFDWAVSGSISASSMQPCGIPGSLVTQFNWYVQVGLGRITADPFFSGVQDFQTAGQIADETPVEDSGSHEMSMGMIDEFLAGALFRLEFFPEVTISSFDEGCQGQAHFNGTLTISNVAWSLV